MNFGRVKYLCTGSKVVVEVRGGNVQCRMDSEVVSLTFVDVIANTFERGKSQRRNPTQKRIRTMNNGAKNQDD